MYTLAILLPLFGSLAAGLLGRWIGDRGAALAATIPMLLSAVLSCFVLFEVAFSGGAQSIELMTWIDSKDLEASWALKFDTLSAVMVCVVSVVASMIHVYSIGYMAHDRSIPRFFCYLSLFTFAMLMLVTADNLIQLFFGWEGVGLTSYLLIGFWYDRPSANAAAIKAFLVNRVGDFGFALGIFAIFYAFGSVELDAIFAAAGDKTGDVISFLGLNLDLLTTICLLLFIGAMGKSAQLGLHTWLPDAMEGPTPVSALIHAATMVTAGVFMVARMSPLFELAPDALVVVTFIGASTAIFAASVALTQNDIKRVIAYSTCSQLGYMFFALGVGAYPAAIFHLMTHAFFKALLFLGSGCVIHAMGDEQDMRKMGGLFPKMRVTGTLMWVASLALAGVPPLAGYYSKDLILESAFAAHTGMGTYAFWVGMVVVFMTAFYAWRLLLMTFHGRSRAAPEVFAEAHEAPNVMLWPNIVLGLGAVMSGGLAYTYFVGEEMASFWGPSVVMLADPNVIEAAHHLPGWVSTLPSILAVAGIVLAFIMYIVWPDLPTKLVRWFRAPYLFFLNKWYFDELYNLLFLRPAFAIGRRLWKTGDEMIIDGFGPDGVAAATRRLAARASRLQSGYLYHYAFAMLIGVVGLITWYLVQRV